MSKVLFWSASEDGSSWYRASLPADALQWVGHHTAVGAGVTPEIVEAADVVVASRVANPEATRYWLTLASRPRGERPLLVLDMDDAYFALDPSNPAAGQWDTRHLSRLQAAMHAADLITVPSEALREHVLAHTSPLVLGFNGGPDKIKVIPNGLHAGWLGTPRDYEADQREITVGWSGTASSARDLDLVSRSLGNIVNYGDGQVKLRLVGIPQHHPEMGTLSRVIAPRLHDCVEAVDWVPHGQPYLSACAAFDIWVAPYRGDEFVQAKFPTKALEAGFLGIPLVVSDVRPYREWDSGELTGLSLVPEDRPWMWGRYLKTLVDSASTRRAMGEAARSRAVHNIMQSVGQQWARTLGIEEAL